MTKVSFEDGTVVNYDYTVYFYSRFSEDNYYFKVEPGNKITELQPITTVDDDDNPWFSVRYFHYTMPDGCSVDIFDNYREISKDDFDDMMVLTVKLMLEKCEE